MKRIGRLNLRDLSGKRLQRPEMKFLVGGCGGYGGYGGDNGDGDDGDGYSGGDLPCNGGSNWECTCISGSNIGKGFCTCDDLAGAIAKAGSYCEAGSNSNCQSKSY